MTLNITPRPVRLGHGKIEKKPWAIIGADKIFSIRLWPLNKPSKPQLKNNNRALNLGFV